MVQFAKGTALTQLVVVVTWCHSKSFHYVPLDHLFNCINMQVSHATMPQVKALTSCNVSSVPPHFQTVNAIQCATVTVK